MIIIFIILLKFLQAQEHVRRSAWRHGSTCSFNLNTVMTESFVYYLYMKERAEVYKSALKVFFWLAYSACSTDKDAFYTWTL